tara:strand:- start:19 stop:222 length:204 start_codon:yes stop_codon:yes gene_type:complete
MKKQVNYEVVDMTEEEEEQMSKDAIDIAERKKKRIEFIEKQKLDKENANKKLKDLGLTDDEIEALRS